MKASLSAWVPICSLKPVSQACSSRDWSPATWPTTARPQSRITLEARRLKASGESMRTHSEGSELPRLSYSTKPPRSELPSDAISPEPIAAAS